MAYLHGPVMSNAICAPSVSELYCVLTNRNPRQHTTSGLECSRGQQRTEREKRRNAHLEMPLREGVLKRPKPETVPTLGERAKKTNRERLVFWIAEVEHGTEPASVIRAR